MKGTQYGWKRLQTIWNKDYKLKNASLQWRSNHHRDDYKTKIKTALGRGDYTKAIKLYQSLKEDALLSDVGKNYRVEYEEALKLFTQEELNHLGGD